MLPAAAMTGATVTDGASANTSVLVVRRNVSLKSLLYEKVEQASHGALRQHVKLQAGISADHAKNLNKTIKELGVKGVSSQAQGDQIRVTGKKIDDLQAVIKLCSGANLGIALQYVNMRN